MNELELKKARFYALRVTNLRPRSIDELKDKLKQKGFSDDTIAQVLSEFIKKGLLNDTKFSKLWINSRMHSNPKGEAVLRQELKTKGIEEQTINSVMQDLKKEYSEYEIVKNLADVRMGFLKDLNKITAKRRLFSYLKRRGFSFEIIMKVVEEEFSKKDYGDFK